MTDKKTATAVKVLLLAVLLIFGPGRLSAGKGAASHRSSYETDQRLSLILQELSGYEPGGNDGVLLGLRDYVHAIRLDPDARRECESALVEFLETEVTLAARLETCRHLRAIGSAHSVPVLSRMLMREETSDAARYALESIPDAAADRALRDGLARSRGKVRLGIMNSLGNRRCRAAVPALIELLGGGGGPEVAHAAADALGRISSPDALGALEAALARARGGLDSAAAGGLLHGAERLVEEGRSEEAAALYTRLFAADLPDSLRRAALRGRILVSGTEGETLLLEVLRGGEEDLRAEAVALIPRVIEAARLPELVPIMESHAPALQMRWLGALSGYSHPAARDAARSLLKSPYPRVRIAALDVMGRLGGEETAAPLIRYAAASRGEEQTAARAALYALSAVSEDGTGGPDRVILAALAGDPDLAEEIELIRAVAARRIGSGKALLLARLESGESRIRLEAVRAMRGMAGAGDVPRLLDLLLEEKDTAVRRELTAVAGAAARSHPRAEDRAVVVEARWLRSEDPDDRAALLRVLGRISDDSTLPLLRQALESADPDIKDAAVRALSDWMTPAARPDLFRIAETTGEAAHHVLALRRYLNSIALDSFEAPETGAGLLIDALRIARRPEEKKTVLGLLTAHPCSAALAAAESLLEDPDTAQEARAAVDKIKQRLK